MRGVGEMKGKALRRALASTDAIRINSDIPIISDSTALVSPDDAKQMLEKNKHNRPVNWNKVEEFADIMRRGDWKLHPQGIILDPNGNILTGQTRLWAIIYADVSVYMRISRGSPSDTAFVIDRGRPQSARDLSSRRTERKHSPTEASVARCVCILRGINKPSSDDIASGLMEKDQNLKQALKECVGEKKSKSFLMNLALSSNLQIKGNIISLVPKSKILADELEQKLLPYSVHSCWGRGVSFGMAMRKAMEIVESHSQNIDKEIFKCMRTQRVYNTCMAWNDATWFGKI